MAVGSLIPLIILFLVVGVVGYYGYQIYLYADELAARGKHKMEKKNVVFTKDGMKVGVKEVRDEDYEAKTQKAFVQAWSYGNESQAKSKSAAKSRSK